MKKEIQDFENCVNPGPVLAVSCRSPNGEENALAVGYGCNCSFDPPMVMVGIVPSRYSYDLIKESGVFVANLVSENNREELEFLGDNSGRDVDKFEELNLEVKDGEKVDAPLLLDFPVNIECEIVNSMKTGSHEMFAGKVVNILADKEYVNDEGEVEYSEINYL